jgi:GNAT superfamily N-acetyltransferase
MRVERDGISRDVGKDCGVGATRALEGQIGVKKSPLTLEFKKLGEGNTDEVFALYKLVSQLTPRGFIAHRTRETFNAILSSKNYSVGAFYRDALVGYQLWVTARNLEFDAVRYPRLAQIANGNWTLFGRGTVVAPGHQGTGLGAHLAARTAELARVAGCYSYQLGQVHVFNTRSLRYALNFGKTLVGISHDEFGPNYVSCYFLGRSELVPNGDESLVIDVERAASKLEHARIVGISQAGERFIYGDAVEYGEAIESRSDEGDQLADQDVGRRVP